MAPLRGVYPDTFVNFKRAKRCQILSSAQLLYILGEVLQIFRHNLTGGFKRFQLKKRMNANFEKIYIYNAMDIIFQIEIKN